MAEPWQIFRTLRQQKGLTQQQFAKDVLTQTRYSFVEQGVVMPSDRTIALLANRLGVSAEWFIDAWAVHRPVVGMKQALWKAFRNHESAVLYKLVEHSSLSQLDAHCYSTWLTNEDVPLQTGRQQLDKAWQMFVRTKPQYVPKSMMSTGDPRQHIVLTLTEAAYMMRSGRCRSAVIWHMKASRLLTQVPSIWQ